MSQQNINSPSSPCSSSSATTTPTSMLPVNTITTTLPNSYNLAVEILNSLAVHHHHQQQQQRQHIDDKISQKLQFQSPESLQNLSLHLLNMTNSSLNPLNNNNNNNNFMNHIHLSSNNNCHDKFHNSSNSSSCRQFKTSINRIEDVSSMHQDNISNPYERLASWSSALSTASPNAVAAFQHALAQLALLGLSSPSSTNTNGIDSNTMSVDNITNLCESTNPVLNLSQEQTSCKLLNNHFKNYDCDNIPASTVNCSIVNPANMHKKSEEGCKIIIRQTADADEHFFKALRGLKVDVSTDLKSSDFQKTSRTTETCNKISALPSPDKSSIHLLDSSQERIKHLSYVEDKKEEKEKRTRSAAELAVDEHFEKSLAAFRASTSSKKSTDHLLHDDHVKSKSVLSNSKDNNSINNISVSSDSYLQNDIPITFDSKIQHKSLQTVPRGELYDVNSILQYNNDNNIKPTSNPNLTISCENTHFFPLTASVSSRQSTNINEMNAENGMNSLTQVHSPTVSTNRFKMKFASSSTSLPPLLPINSFKPKKNWLAQYDWRYQQSETTNISPTTPNTNQSIFDSSGSSPSSVNITGESMEDVQQISNISMPKLHIISELCNINSLSKNNGKNNDDNNDGLFTEEAPDIKNDQDYIFVHSSSSSCSSSSFSTNNTNEHCEINSNTDQQQHQQRSVNTPPKIWNINKSKFSFPKIDTTPLDDKEDGGKSEAKKKLDCQVYLNTEDFRGKRKTEEDTDEKQFPTSSDKNNNPNRSNQDSNWRFSSSMSSSPIFQDNEQTSEEDPSKDAFFSSGSTYSLDSTINSGSFKRNEMNAMISNKDNNHSSKLKDEVSSKFSTGQQSLLHQSHSCNKQYQLQSMTSEMNDKFDNDEALHNSWSLRKRVSSDVSPWSTLKRSRSVLTSPSLSSDKSSVNIASSSELCSEEAYQINEECEMYNVNDRGFVHSKSMDSTLNPFDSINSNIKLSKCIISKCKSISDTETLTEKKKTCSEPNVPTSGSNTSKEKSLTGALSSPSFRQLEHHLNP